MAGITKRVLIVSVVIGLTGTFIQMQGVARAEGKDDDFLEKISPAAVGEYTFMASTDDPGRSYPISKEVIETLKPFGVVPRIYKDSRTNRQIEVLLVSSNTKESFHDQRVCFPAQGNTPLPEELLEIDTDRGPLPITIAPYDTPRGKMLTAYLYRGPNNRYFHRPGQLTFAMLMTALKGGTNLDSNFYRFLTQDADVTKDDIMAFARDYFNAASKTSNGYL